MEVSSSTCQNSFGASSISRPTSFHLGRQALQALTSHDTLTTSHPHPSPIIMTKQSPTAIVGSPIHFPFSGLTAPNRTLKSAMTERLCTYDETNLEARGHVTPEYINLYKTWGEGKIGVIVLGNLPIQREALEAKKNMIIDKDNVSSGLSCSKARQRLTLPLGHQKWDAAEELKPVIQACKAHGSLVIGQLTHGGRQVSEEIVKTPRSSSDIQAPPMGTPSPANLRRDLAEAAHLCRRHDFRQAHPIDRGGGRGHHRPVCLRCRGPVQGRRGRCPAS